MSLNEKLDPQWFFKPAFSRGIIFFKQILINLISKSELLWLNSGWGLPFSPSSKPWFIVDCSWRISLLQITFNEAPEFKLRQNKFPPEGYSKFLLIPPSRGTKHVVILLPWFPPPAKGQWGYKNIYLLLLITIAMTWWHHAKAQKVNIYFMTSYEKMTLWFFMCLISVPSFILEFYSLLADNWSILPVRISGAISIHKT